MKIGYPCINLSLKCRSSKTFRLKNYSEDRLINIVNSNLIWTDRIIIGEYWMRLDNLEPNTSRRLKTCVPKQQWAPPV